MTDYGYPWPEIVSCEQFPIDNDMCIQAQSEVARTKATTAPPHHSSGHHHRRKPASSSPGLEHDAIGTHHQNGGGRKKSNPGKKRKHHMRSEFQEPPPAPHHQPQHMHQPQPEEDAFSFDSLMVTEPVKDRPMLFNQAALSSSSQAEGQYVSDHHATPKDPLYHQVIENYCKSSWILKARLATVNRPVLGPSNRHVVKLRNYQPLEGGAKFPPFQRHESMALILVPAIDELNGNLTQSLVAGADRSRRASEGAGRRRYLIMGDTINDENLASFAMPWPHKSGPFRKALKAIKQGQVNCRSINSESGSTAATVETTTASSETLIQTARPSKRARAQKGNRGNHHRKSSSPSQVASSSS